MDNQQQHHFVAQFRHYNGHEIVVAMLHLRHDQATLSTDEAVTLLNARGYIGTLLSLSSISKAQYERYEAEAIEKQRRELEERATGHIPIGAALALGATCSVI